ncbi:MAG: putative porin [Candidatus Binatia bacterium]
MQLMKTVIPLVCAGGLVLGSFWAAPAYAQRKSVAEELIEILEADGKISSTKADELRQRAKVENEAREAGVEAFRRDPVKAVKDDKSFDWLKRLSFSGDIRWRTEGFYQDDVNARTRERVRFRLGMKAKISDELEAELRLATGSVNDPISTNQTLGDAFNKKSFNLDRAYIKITPGATFGLGEWNGLSIYAGKMKNTVWSPEAGMGSEMIFDGDLTPDGTAQTLTLYSAAEGVLRKFELNAIQWFLKESSRAAEAMTWGGQMVGTFQVFKGVGLTLGIGDYYFSHRSLIAKERNNNGDLAVTNNVVLKDGTIVGGRSISPNSANPIVDFAGGFNIFTVGSQLDVDTGYSRWPLSFFVDYALNTDAYSNDDTAVWAGVGLGKTKDPGDFSIAAIWARTETDSVLSMFSYSDFGSGGTNRQGPFLALNYQLLPNLTLTAKNHFVSWIDRPSEQSNATLNRLQLDAQMKF